MTSVSRRAHRRHDRAGDPLDGLVNLFDLGIVLAVGFLLAALSSMSLTDALRPAGARQQPQVVVPSDAAVQDVPSDGGRVVGRGQRVGEVYRLADGRLVYVVPREARP
ncbi:DUF2149 domain-containing protein [Nocardioides sp. TRM66260-LWL]|uniref:DUF2149 domain-containing protein n=1 Tax=Nocardioides sp. TRM66260-LWL TaxID=2874478 RepID=UPI001CC41F4C|nr:DUF2149 domain-containing protein [Nocardioides sp. TRM66260-LWL]MBZ5735061.1 DUF2149 domain-containing protein [Nocardioides sp. TRM66260-LWL]